MGAGQFERPRRRAWRVPPCLRDRAASRDTGRGGVVGDSTGREAEVSKLDSSWECQFEVAPLGGILTFSGSRVAEQTDLARARRLRGDQGVLGRDLRNAAFDVANMALECLVIQYESEVFAEFGQEVAG